MTANNSNAQNMDKLRERYEELNRKKITAAANLQTSSDKLDELKNEAREKYGTDDLTALRQMLETMKEENERKRAEYQKHLTTIESQLVEVEAKHAEAARKEN